MVQDLENPRDDSNKRLHAMLETYRPTHSIALRLPPDSAFTEACHALQPSQICVLLGVYSGVRRQELLMLKLVSLIFATSYDVVALLIQLPRNLTLSHSRLVMSRY